MTATAMTESFDLVSALIEVRRTGVGALTLLRRCDEWFASHAEHDVRERFRGSRMLEPQLDIFDQARDRVRAVSMNCIALIPATAAA